MESVSVADVQELVRQLPEDKLPHAYRLLRDLAAQHGTPSPQVDFMHLPVSERRRLLTQQADEIVRHYEQSASERQDWQSGDFQDDY